MTEENLQIELGQGEAAIVFNEEGIRIFTPTLFDDIPLNVRETIEFVTYALLKPEWILEFHEYIATAEALMDLMGKKEVAPPELKLIKGGLYDEASEDNNNE